MPPSRRATRSVSYTHLDVYKRQFRSSNSPPALIDAFLTEHWVGVLHKIAVREDPNETDWQTAKEAMKDLSWSIEAKKTPDDRLKLIGMLPKLLAQINKGLDLSLIHI